MGLETAAQTPIQALMSQPVDQLMVSIFWLVGWIPIAIVFLYGSVLLFVFWRQGIYTKTLKFTLLAIDIPKANEQSLKAVEQMFTYLGGAHDAPDLIEKYWDGRYQLAVSYEIAGIEGYTQFLVRTPNDYRELVEASIYATYPDAEITEVNDYCEGIPMHYPNDEYNVWGGEFIYVKPDIYPLKTYKEFEVQGTKPGEGFKDPLATLMDMYASLKKGEQFWMQLLVYPTGFDWPARGEKEISKVIGEKVKTSQPLWASILGLPVLLIDNLAEILFGINFSGESKEEEKDGFKMMNLKPKQKKQIEAIQTKISQVGFECKLRFAYVAKKEVYKKEKAIFGIIGWMKQFADLDLNNMKPDMEMTATTAHYLFIDYRKNIKKGKLMTAYRDRTGTRGRKRFIMTPDELATLWHFPVESAVHAPLIQKATGRRSEPPMSLPLSEQAPAAGFSADVKSQYENIFSDLEEKSPVKKAEPEQNEKPLPDIFAEEAGEKKAAAPVKESERDQPPMLKGQPPANLPFA